MLMHAIYLNLFKNNVKTTGFVTFFQHLFIDLFTLINDDNKKTSF
jgi:hypothetical protein